MLLLLLSGSMKLLKPAPIVESFEHFGYPQNVIVALGIVEIASALIYAIPQTAVLGAILMTGFLGGATATHVRVGEPFVVPVIVGVLVWLGLFLATRGCGRWCRCNVRSRVGRAERVPP